MGLWVQRYMLVCVCFSLVLAAIMHTTKSKMSQAKIDFYFAAAEKKIAVKVEKQKKNVFSRALERKLQGVKIERSESSGKDAIIASLQEEVNILKKQLGESSSVATLQSQLIDNVISRNFPEGFS